MKKRQIRFLILPLILSVIQPVLASDVLNLAVPVTRVPVTFDIALQAEDEKRFSVCDKNGLTFDEALAELAVRMESKNHNYLEIRYPGNDAPGKDALKKHCELFPIAKMLSVVEIAKKKKEDMPVLVTSYLPYTYVTRSYDKFPDFSQGHDTTLTVWVGGDLKEFCSFGTEDKKMSSEEALAEMEKRIHKGTTHVFLFIGTKASLEHIENFEKAVEILVKQYGISREIQRAQGHGNGFTTFVLHPVENTKDKEKQDIEHGN